MVSRVLGRDVVEGPERKIGQVDVGMVDRIDLREDDGRNRQGKE